MAGCFDATGLQLELLHRFENPMCRIDGHLRWSVPDLWNGILTGLREAAGRGLPVRSVGVDTWGVDYALVSAEGNLLELPICYRDGRTEGLMPAIFERLPPAEIYARSGIQLMEINTLFQVYSQARSRAWPAAAARLLMMPDLFHFLLSGRQENEYTIASTTGLLDARSRRWDPQLLELAGLPAALLGEPRAAGCRLGPLLPQVARQTGLEEVQVVAPAGHDTACAVAGTPLPEGFGYVSSGTWSLIGVETRAPVLSEDAERFNFTNEGGVEGTYRLLKNVSGLWLLESCLKSWRERGLDKTYEEWLGPWQDQPPGDSFVIPDAPAFDHPDDMPAAIDRFLEESGQARTQSPSQMCKVILDSLALRYASVVDQLEVVTGEKIRGLRIVGGGCQNEVLNQASANALGRPVQVGPVEATAIGNLTVQAICDERFNDLSAARAQLDHWLPPQILEPCQGQVWNAARQRFASLEARLS
jgi:rhamnulokinase